MTVRSPPDAAGNDPDGFGVENNKKQKKTEQKYRQKRDSRFRFDEY